MTTRRIARRKFLPTSVEGINNNVRCYTTQSFGLCNQIFIIGCAIADGIHYKTAVSFQGFCPEMTSKNFVSIEKLLNLEKTNKNLATKGTRIVVKRGGRLVKSTMFPETDWQKAHQTECIRLLVFSDEILKLSKSLSQNTPYYCVHFRLDIDVLLFNRSGPDIYLQWISLTDRKFEQEARKLASAQVEIHKEWIKQHVSTYVNAVKQYCKDESLPIVTLTAIGKQVMLKQNDLMEWAFQEFATALAPRKIVRNTEFKSIGREYSAAVELNIACNENCVGFIGANQSTFSSTINMKIHPSKQLCNV